MEPSKSSAKPPRPPDPTTTRAVRVLGVGEQRLHRPVVLQRLVKPVAPSIRSCRRLKTSRMRPQATAGVRPASSIRPCEPQVEVADRRPEHAAGARWGRQSPEHGQNGWRGITKLPPDLVGDSGRIMRRAQPNGLRSIGNAARMGRHVGDGRSVTCRPSRGRQRSGRQSPEPPREPGPLGRGPFRSASRHSRRLGRRR